MRVVFVGRDRVIWRRMVLYVLTLGISRRIWLYRVQKELDGHEILGTNHRLNAVLLWLPIIGPSIVTARTASQTRRMLAVSDIPYGPAPLVYLATWIPILGNLFFIAWEQSRLNAFWAYEKEHPEHGVDLDVGLEKDPRFLVEIEAARKESYKAGSRFDRKQIRRREARLERRRHWDAIRAERLAVRLAGGSTPLLPWRRPKRPLPRRLNITCGRCEHRFEVTQDPFAETPLLCPKCGLAEVLPSLHSDGLAEPERAVFAAFQADCPDCGTHFYGQRRLDGPTTFTCPECGRQDTLPAPKQTKGKTRKTPVDKGATHGQAPS